MAKSIKFTCTKSECPNNGIDYFWGNSTETEAECGGCGTILEAQDA